LNAVRPYYEDERRYDRFHDYIGYIVLKSDDEEQKKKITERFISSDAMIDDRGWIFIPVVECVQNDDKDDECINYEYCEHAEFKKGVEIFTPEGFDKVLEQELKKEESETKAVRAKYDQQRTILRANNNFIS